MTFFFIIRCMIHKTLDDFLDNNNDHLICYIVSNFDGFNLVKNCLLSAQKSNVSIVLFALDEEIAEEISKLFEIDIVIFLVGIDKNQTYKYGTFEWIDIVYNRYFIAHRLMKDGRNIVYMDTDVVIMKDFTKNIKRKLRNHQIVIQTNGNNCCTGFFAMRSCPELIWFFSRKKMTEKNYRSYGGNGGPSDQKFFNAFIGSDMEKYQCVFLERELYPNGQYYYDYNEEIEQKCFIIHFNCIQGEVKKIKRMKMYQKFYLDL